MTLSMEFICNALGTGKARTHLNGLRNPFFEKVRLLDSDCTIENNILYVCLQGTIDISRFSKTRNTGIVLTNKDSNICREIPVLQFLTCTDPVKAFNEISEIFSKFEKWSEKVYGTFLLKQDAQELLLLLNEVTDNPWYLADTSYRVLAARKDSDAEEMSYIWRFLYNRRHLPLNIVISLAKEGKMEKMNRRKHAYIPEVSPFNVPFVSKTIFSGNELIGHLFIIGIYSKLSQYEIEIAEFYGNILTQKLTGSSTYMPTFGGLYDNYFIDLIKGTKFDDEGLLENLFKLFSWDYKDRFVITVFSENDENSPEVDKLTVYIIENTHHGKCFLYKKNIVAVFNLSQKEASFPGYSKTDFKQEIRGILKEVGGCAAYSETFTGISEFRNLKLYYEQASAALESAASSSVCRLYGYSEIAVQHFCRKIALDENYRILYLKELDILRDYDSRNNAHLYETLWKYLINEQNTVQTAKDLFVHRNTLMKRLQKIEELTALDLSDVNVRIRILLSCEMKEAIAFFEDSM